MPYHNKFVPVAVSGEAIAAWQYVKGVVAAGASGNAVTFTVMAALDPSPQLVVWLT